MIDPGNVAGEGVRVNDGQAVSQDVSAEADVPPQIRVRPGLGEAHQQECEDGEPNQKDAGGLG